MNQVCLPHTHPPKTHGWYFSICFGMTILTIIQWGNLTKSSYHRYLSRSIRANVMKNITDMQPVRACSYERREITRTYHTDYQQWAPCLYFRNIFFYWLEKVSRWGPVNSTHPISWLKHFLLTFLGASLCFLNILGTVYHQCVLSGRSRGAGEIGANSPPFKESKKISF